MGDQEPQAVSLINDPSPFCALLEAVTAWIIAFILAFLWKSDKSCEEEHVPDIEVMLLVAKSDRFAGLPFRPPLRENRAGEEHAVSTEQVNGDARDDFEEMPEALLAEREREFRELLFHERSKIFQNLHRTLTEDMTMDHEDLADEMDQVTFDQSQALSLRLRGRERQLLNKIEEAIHRLDEGDYWWCNDCDVWIGFNRLRARPVTTLCIVCKERREKRERGSGG